MGGDNTAETKEEEINVDEPTEQPQSKPDAETEEVNASTSEESSTVKEEKDSSLSKKQSRKTLLSRFRAWWVGMFSVKGEQPGSVTKVFSDMGTNLRNSLRRTKSPKKEKKSTSEEEASADKDKDSVMEEAAAQV